MKGERNEKEVAWNLCRLEMSYLEEACNICTIHQYDLLDPRIKTIVPNSISSAWIQN